MAENFDSCQIFEKLCYRFSCLLCTRNEKQCQQLDSMLNELNALNFRLPVVTNNNKAILLVHQLCTVLPPSGPVLTVEKCCKLIVNLISTAHVLIEGRTLLFAIEWTLEVLKLIQSPSVIVLNCLEVLIRDRVDKIEKVLPRIIGPSGILHKFTQNDTEEELQFWAIKCMEALVYFSEDPNFQNTNLNPVYLDTCFQVFLHSLTKEKQTGCNEIIYCKLLISCLRGLESVVLRDCDVGKSDFDLLLGISKCYMTYILFDSIWIKPMKILPSNLTIGDLKTNVFKEKKGGKVMKQRKQRKSTSTSNKKEEIKRNENANDDNITTSYTYNPVIEITENASVPISDSDFSDSETGRSNKIGLTQGRVRQAALQLLLSIVKVTDKHKMFGYWSSFFYDGSPTNERNLNQCLLKEPSTRARSALLNVILTILNGSKLYLSQAETSEKMFAFTPFSIVLGSMIVELHKCLCSALNANYSVPIVTQTLKCLAALVQATPYNRLASGLITDVVTNVKPFIRHTNATIQVAALIVLGCVVASEPPVDETLANLFQYESTKKHHQKSPTRKPIQTDPESEYIVSFSSEDEAEAELTEPNEDNMSWLLKKCFRNLNWDEQQIVPAPVKLETVQLLAAMCRIYYRVVLAPHIVRVAKVLEIALNDKYLDMQLHASRTVDSIGHAMQEQLALITEPKSVLDKSLTFWQILLNGPLTNLIQNENHSPALRASGCDCLGSIGSHIYEHLPKDKQILIITLLFSCSRDVESNVKGAAVRALAISVLYPTLQEDFGYVMDTSEAIMRTLNDSNVPVRVKASWALGNLSDALVLYRSGTKNEELPDDLIESLLHVCTKVANDSSNKIRWNVTRAMGNLLRLVTPDLLAPDSGCKQIVENTIALLATNATSSSDMKVRWNSCYAIANLMKNNDLFIYCKDWQLNVYTALIYLVTNYRNFKVRINAALALSAPEKRTYFGEYYFPVWKALLDALDSSQNIDDFAEFKHRDNLVDQLCLTICHLTTFLTADDLNTIGETAFYHLETLKMQMRRVHERLVPEKVEILIQTADYVQNFQHKQLSNEEVTFITLFKSVFVYD